ncbi:uncharacterized protein I206_103168 [Kwoniella pini CBS 10737]|uniref:Uncharacterized protein n=1 Tax=Kwoniella pini CBS 10737 TaxID=1296096 RepID=A0A1B9IAE8_9TREE|nr:uncharacterized protein I206_01827 [Kwoniella pini CBS 10737]OCF52536.1 hypothetical protein I206_01827 [Kwoniella pini CBS 10737]
MSRQENYPSTNLSVRKPPPGDNQSQLQFSSQGQPGSTDQQTSSEDDRALLRELGIYSGIVGTSTLCILANDKGSETNNVLMNFKVDESYNLSNQNPDSEAESKSHESVGKGPDCPEGWAKIQLSDDDKNESPQYTCLTEEQVDDLRNYARNISGSDTN